ncbi:hypothetical protein CHH28_17050 [Bacterioplanes sanyensis]|uniref:DUF3325 domain-containing protein n=1 Tax=Bacterioplanes sanyensis TaxID=1249553 RepID=A0A222FMM9_9GAMM|nr:DUF3325 family protein [Bacterioplanes sanyensis]ASP40278.1 hypothetical protein CHH28_17050 [Bacterioplanes sanyensis]
MSFGLLLLACLCGCGCGQRQRKLMALQRPSTKVRRCWQWLLSASVMTALWLLLQSYSVGVAWVMGFAQLMLAGLLVALLLAWKPGWCAIGLRIFGATGTKT